MGGCCSSCICFGEGLIGATYYSRVPFLFFVGLVACMYGTVSPRVIDVFRLLVCRS